MMLSRLIFGRVEFPEGAEYRKFQHRFACVLILFGTVVTGTFIVADIAGAARLHPNYLWGGAIYCFVNMAALALLRRDPGRLGWLAPICMTASFVLEGIAFTSNIEDEMRIVWFALSIPSAYLIVGRSAGLLLTALSVLFISIGNGHMSSPYSANAIVTMDVAICYISAFFYAFSAKSISFHHAMVVANQKLADLASKDPLTGLFNARAYYALCERALLQAHRTGSPFAMLFVDLDHFKKVNDTHGHEAGDIVLRSVSACLTRAVRQSDLVGRIGGEEFSIMLPDTDLDGARNLAEKLRQDIEYLMPDIGATCLRITASIGVAPGRTEYRTVGDVQRRADEAMYEAKRGGRNRVTCIDDLAVNRP
jgi:diguanylate cyclase (GGDEF)-like protein